MRIEKDQKRQRLACGHFHAGEREDTGSVEERPQGRAESDGGDPAGEVFEIRGRASAAPIPPPGTAECRPRAAGIVAE